MKPAVGVFIVFFSFLLSIFMGANTVNAQVGQLWETIVGNPQPEAPPVYDDEGIEQGGTGPDDLGPGEFRLPFKCSLKYDSRTYPTHSAFSIDLNRGLRGEDEGDPVYASADGVVVEFYFDTGLIIIKHEGGYFTLYQHMWPVLVKEGQRVKAGQKIGEVNDRGADEGAHHIHFNVCRNCTDVLHQCQIPPAGTRGCRVPVKFKGYPQDPNSIFPGAYQPLFYYSKCY